MKTFFSDKSYYLTDCTCITVGTFDGVHCGHDAVLNFLKTTSKRKKLASLVFTFDRHPRFVLKKDVEMLNLLNTLTEKTEILEKKCIDYMFVQKFNDDFYSLSAETFIKEILIDKLNMKSLVVGYDHFFGHNREGSAEFLSMLSEKYGFDVCRLPAVYDSGIAVSSTKIRKSLNEGDVDFARNMLGYNYFFSGKVVHGFGVGKTLGFPTANLECDSAEKLLPSNGVYIVNVYLDGSVFHGVMNLGNKPTFNGCNRTIEVNIFDFDSDIYGKKIKIEFLLKIRNEIKFNSKEDLMNQISKDKEKTLCYFNNLC